MAVEQHPEESDTEHADDRQPPSTSLTGEHIRRGDQHSIDGGQDEIRRAENVEEKRVIDDQPTGDQIVRRDVDAEAGVHGDGQYQRVDKEEVRRVGGSKVDGARVLTKLLLCEDNQSEDGADRA